MRRLDREGWRIWAFVAGFPVGVLAAKAWLVSQPSPSRILYCGAGVGIVWLLIVSAVDFIRERDPWRQHHLGVAASAGLVAVGPLIALLRGLGSESLLAAMALSVMAAAAIHAAFTKAMPGGAPRQLAAAGGHLVVGILLTCAITYFAANQGKRPPEFDERRAALILDIDAKVATRATPQCRTEAQKGEILLERGARPRFSSSGDLLWFDAETADGTRQIHTIRLDSGEVTCWTCGEDGNNLRPVPGPLSVVFETDRYTTWSDPLNTDLHLLRTPSSGQRDGASKRLTHLPGPDSHAVIGPEADRIVWSRLESGRYAVVSARLSQSHGGLSLGRNTVLEAGGTLWMAPVAWSPDARTLAVATGNPYSPLSVHGVDFATGETVDLGDDVAGAGSVTFNGDGAVVVTAVASGAGNAPGSWIPDTGSFALGGFAAHSERNGPLLHSEGAILRVAERGEAGTQIPLGEAGDWGAFTGVSALPDLSAVVIGQHRTSGDGAERMLWIDLDCRS